MSGSTGNAILAVLVFPGLTPVQTKVATYLVGVANGKRVCWPSVADIMRDLGIDSNRTVSTATGVLADKGLIRIERHQRWRNHYHIADYLYDTSADLPSRRGVVQLDAHRDVQPVAHRDVQRATLPDVQPVALHDVQPVAHQAEDVQPVARRDVQPVAHEDVQPVAHIRQTQERDSRSPRAREDEEEVEVEQHRPGSRRAGANGFGPQRWPVGVFPDGPNAEPHVNGFALAINAERIQEITGIEVVPVLDRALIGWLLDGYDSDQVRNILRGVVERDNYRPPRMLSWFDRAVRDHAPECWPPGPRASDYGLPRRYSDPPPWVTGRIDTPHRSVAGAEA